MQASASHRLLVGFVVMVTVVLSWTATASAHEGESTDKAADLVRQAIAVLVNEPDNTDAADRDDLLRGAPRGAHVADHHHRVRLGRLTPRMTP